MLGTHLEPPVGDMPPEPENADLPESFDGRDKFKKCIHPVRNQ